MKNETEQKVKTEEILRLKAIFKRLGKTRAEIAEETGIAERTITNYEWNNQPIGGQLLRQLQSRYGVSLDWLLTGRGVMFLEDLPLPALSVERAPVAERLIPVGVTLDNGNFSDAYRLFAAGIEQSLLESGALAGVDYRYLDLYQLATPHVLQESQINRLKLAII